MKLDHETQKALMRNHKTRLDAELEAMLDVPTIRDSVSKHSASEQGYVQKTLRRDGKRVDA